MVIVGGGYISVEFAGIFQGLGVAVTQLYRGEQILRGFDDDLRDGLADEMRLRGVDLRTNTDIAEIAGNKGAYTITLKDGSQLETELVMYATGRNPDTQGLGLENAGVELGDKGKIVIDDDQRTTCDTIYAVGDVTDRFALTPVAIKEGHAFADSAFGDKPWRVDHKLIPTAVFSQPELGTVGLTEAEARAATSNLDIYKARFRPMLHTLSGRNEHMLFKLLVDGNNDRVLGCHIIGPDAAEIVQIAAIALRLNATKADFDATMALHPSAAEELVTMRQKWLPPAEAAE
jgi:glutathione reductase (NADPH)